MMAGLKELLKKKAMKGEFMDDKHKCAAESILNDMDDMADEATAKGMQKVTVAADSKENLKKGLNKAEEVLDKSPMEADMEGKLAEDKMEDELMSDKEKVADESYSSKPDYEDMDEEDDMSDDDIDAMIAMLKEKKAKKSLAADSEEV